MHLRGTVSWTLALSLNLSLCTGGVLSSFTVFAAEVEQTTQHEEIAQSVPMSFALLEFMSCTVSEEQTEGVANAHIPRGCTNKQICLSQSHQSTIDRLQFVDATVLDASLPKTEIRQIVIAYEEHLSATARAGPLFEESIGYAHSLRKRE